ncbi:MAG TPA: amino acid ABC transporter permease [Stellaceae bacterium]|nr:amino acid ABC transporter permease [Stellaceae bacterium]
MPTYHFDFAPIWAHRDLLIAGLARTIAVSAAALVLALVLGTLVGTLAAARARAWRVAATASVEMTRNVPLLIHLYLWYVGFAFLRLPPFLCAVLGLAIYSAAYVAEIVRAGIAAVPRGQSEAALALGLSRGKVLGLVVYPQALRIIAPSLASLFSQLIKDSSLASVITVGELSFAASAIESETFRSFEIYITVALLYLALVTAASRLVLLFPGAHRPALHMGFADA